MKNHKELGLEITPVHLQRQIDYHTLYLYQVLTLDRGTTSGLLVHDQNDLGTMGSLPRQVNLELLDQWSKIGDPLRNWLTGELVRTLRDGRTDSAVNNVVVDEAKRLALAETVRMFYRKHPEAIKTQAPED